MKSKSFNIPRILIGATASGGGKTTVTCGILKALKNRNKDVRAFKCGPDYIDPMFHTKVLKIPSGNLDLFFNDKETVKFLLHRNTEGCDIAVMEGVMGYYDGVAGKTTDAGAYDLAKKTATPAVLVIDCRGKSLSVAAEIKGFLQYRADSQIQGVILNRISAGMYEDIKNIVEDELDVAVLGYMPVMKDITLESRHLGLVTADEIGNLEEIIDIIAEQVEKTVDMDKLEEIAKTATELTYDISQELEDTAIPRAKTLRIAIAKDNAFCFYYSDNLKLLETLGAELIPFSPVAGEELPKDIDGLILGGGYPELYLKELSENIKLAEDIRTAVKNGMPCIAECGGFMYLHKWIEDKEGNRHNTVGLLDEGCCYLGRLGRFGYIDVTLDEDTLMGAKGETFKAHEFHYWDSENPGDSATAQKPLRKRNWKCIVAKENLFAGYPHIHYYSNINTAKNFVNKCEKYKAQRRRLDV